MRIELELGDITEYEADAIVNAASPELLGGGGVDGAIHASGGPEILEQTRHLRDTTLPDGLARGAAVATRAGRLPADWVIHTVGPVWSATRDQSDVLESCYRESLRVADELGARHVAFPAISAGVYGWPIDDAARIAVSTVHDSVTDVERVSFVLHDRTAYDAFQRALQTLPTDEPASDTWLDLDE